MYKSYKKICPKCKNNKTKKDWKRKGRQSYKCNICKHIWINKKRETNIKEKMYEDFAIHKQNYSELALKYWCSKQTIQKYLDSYKIKEQKYIKPGETILFIDTTYFWEFWIMAFKDKNTKRILKFKVVGYETNKDYKEWINELIKEWWKIKAIVCDWRKWLLWWFWEIPTQMCHFHQKQIWIRYLTRNPKLQANKDLLELIKWLPRTDKESFECFLYQWYEKYKYWLSEQSEDKNWKKYYIHKKTRSAYFSLKRNLKYLFIYLDYYLEVDIPNTTNALESLFGYVKNRIRVHSWLKKERKIKLISYILSSIK